MTDKRMKGMDVRFGGKTLRLRAVISAVREPDRETLGPFAARLQRAVSGPGQRMTMVGFAFSPAAVLADVFTNTDEEPEAVLKRLRDALVATPPTEAAWMEHGLGDNTLLSAGALEPEDAKVFWEKFIATAAEELRKRP